MHAIKLEVIVPEDRQLTIALPSEIPPGKAEVIVLAAEPAKEASNVQALLNLVREWRERHPEGRSKEEIDRYLEEERASWGDEE
jgi:hypothetical protein